MKEGKKDSKEVRLKRKKERKKDLKKWTNPEKSSSNWRAWINGIKRNWNKRKKERKKERKKDRKKENFLRKNK